MAATEMSRDECLRLMASVSAGRIIYSRRALPAVDLVHFALERDEIVISIDGSGGLATAVRGAVVAFETDWLDPGGHLGWSVTAIGRSREVTDPVELARLRELGLSSWAPRAQGHFVTISPELLTGRYLDGGPRRAVRTSGRVALAD